MPTLHSTKILGDFQVTGITNLHEAIAEQITVPTSQATDTILTSDGNITATKFLGGLDYTTVVPTANNTNGIKIYVGSADPGVKYTGWLYIITS